MPKPSDLQDSLGSDGGGGNDIRLQHMIINLFADGRGRCQQRAVLLKDKEKGEIGLMSRICHKYQNCMQLTLNKLYLPLSLGGVRLRMWLMVNGVVRVIYRISRLWRMC